MADATQYPLSNGDLGWSSSRTWVPPPSPFDAANRQGVAHARQWRNVLDRARELQVLPSHRSPLPEEVVRGPGYRGLVLDRYSGDYLLNVMHCFLCGTKLSVSRLNSGLGRRHFPVILPPTCRVCGVLAGVADVRRVRNRVERLSRFGLSGEHKPLLSDPPNGDRRR